MADPQPSPKPTQEEGDASTAQPAGPHPGVPAAGLQPRSRHDHVEVVLPDHLPVLTSEAAAILLDILFPASQNDQKDEI